MTKQALLPHPHFTSLRLPSIPSSPATIDCRIELDSHHPSSQITGDHNHIIIIRLLFSHPSLPRPAWLTRTSKKEMRVSRVFFQSYAPSITPRAAAGVVELGGTRAEPGRTRLDFDPCDMCLAADMMFTVSWKWGSGRPGGTVAEVAETGSIEIESNKGNTIKKNADPSDPAVHVERPGNDVVKRAHEVSKVTTQTIYPCHEC